MSDMKCPFCQQELESVLQLVGAGGLVEEAYLLCSKCNIRGERKLWQELIRTRKALETGNKDLSDKIGKLETELDRTRKALDVANEKLRHCVNITVEELDELKGNLLIAWNALVHFSKDPIANNALKKITALEQKDVK